MLHFNSLLIAAISIAFLSACVKTGLEPAIDGQTARALVAADLCPKAPERVMSELIPSFDSGIWNVYVRARPEITDAAQIKTSDDVIALYTVLGSSNPRVGAAGPEAESFRSETRLACSRLPG